jgi:hypothetical protein
MPLYHWDSEALRNYGLGHILVEAENVAEARRVARECFISQYGYIRQLDEDLQEEPTSNTAYFIEGSD